MFRSWRCFWVSAPDKHRRLKLQPLLRCMCALRLLRRDVGRLCIIAKDLALSKQDAREEALLVLPTAGCTRTPA